MKIINDCHCVVCSCYIPEGEGMVCKQCQNIEPQQLPLKNIQLPLKNIHIENSYTVWSTTAMYGKILVECWQQYHGVEADKILNRSYKGMYIEWYLHNIGYWLTLPFIKKESIKSLNERFKHVDLEEHR